MSDMFDTYNRTLATGLQRSVNDWKAHSARQDAEIARLRAENARIGELETDVWCWASVASARGVLIDELLNEIDDISSAENNRFRQKSATQVAIPNGERAGQNIQERDRIFLTALKRIIENNCPQIGSWKALIRKYSFI